MMSCENGNPCTVHHTCRLHRLIGEHVQLRLEIEELRHTVGEQRVQLANLRLKYEELPVRCNLGHWGLPMKLWDCPTCTEILRTRIVELEEQHGNPTK